MEKYTVLTDEEGYEIVLGQGAYGKVKKVKCNANNKVLACKVIHYLAHDSPRSRSPRAVSTREDIQREYSILKNLDHPHIVKYIDIEWPIGKRKVKMYMEFCEKGNLQDRIDQSYREGKRLSERFIRQAFEQIARALTYCHTGHDSWNVFSPIPYPPEPSDWKAILHRDLKPSNVLLTHSPVEDKFIFKLGDFGLGTVLDPTKPPSTYLGTRLYMPPEISHEATSSICWTKKCDIFSFGCTMYALCELDPPFADRMRQPSEPLLPISPIYSSALRLNILECLQYDPELRPNAESLPTMFIDYGSLTSKTIEQVYHSSSDDAGVGAAGKIAKVPVDVALHQLEPVIQSDYQKLRNFFQEILQVIMRVQQEEEEEEEEGEEEEISSTEFWDPLKSMIEEDASS